MDNGNAVTAGVALRLVAPTGETTTLNASFSYASDDPYAVRVSFHVGLDSPVSWVFARELLSGGLQGPQGLGDVRVWPSARAKAGLSGGELHLSISSPYGRADFKAPAPPVDDFLRRTYEVVPAGTEGRHLDIDAGLAELLPEA